MNKVQIKGGTLDGSELMNAASEATLILVKEAIEKLAKQNSSQAKKANNEIKNLGESARDTSEATEDLGDDFRTLSSDLRWLTGSGFRLLGNAILSFGKGLFGAGTEVLAFGNQMLDSQMNVTDFSGAIAQSSLNVLGLGTAFDRVIKLLYANYTSFQDLSSSGILLNGTIADLQSEAASQRLELSQLTRILGQSSERLALLGTATDGARLAMRSASAAYDMNADVLRAWGINFEEQGELFTSFLGINALALRRRTMTETQLVNSSASYAINLRQLSNLTGKSVDELRQQMERQNMSAAFDSFVSTLSAEEQERIRMMVAEYGATYGDAGAELAQAAVMGIPPVTEAATAMAGVLPQLNEEILSQASMARSFNGSTTEFMAVVRERNNELANSMQSWIDQNSSLAQVLFLQGDPIGQAFQSIISGLNIYSGNIDEVNRAREAQEDPTVNMLIALDEALGSLREAAVKLTTDFFNNDAVKKSLNDFAEWIKNIDYTKYNPFDEQGRANIAASFNTLVSNMGDIFREFWNGPNAVALRDSISSMFRLVVEEIILAIEGIIPTFGAAGRIREERALSSLTEEDRAAAVSASEGAVLTENQEVYRGLLDEAVSLQRTLNAFGPNAELDPYGAAITSGIEEELARIIEKLPDGAAADISQRAIEEEISNLNRLLEEERNRLSRSLAGENVYWGTETSGRSDSEARIRELEAQISSYAQQIRSNTALTDTPEQPVVVGDNPEREISRMENRRIGTLKATGRTSEPKDTVAKIHAGERVLNPDEASAYNNNSNTESQRDVVNKLEELNTSMQTLVRLMTQELAIQSRTMNTISGLGPDLMKGIPS